MSAWLLAAREVYDAGGRKPVNQMWSPPDAIAGARNAGLLEPAAVRGFPARWAPVVLSAFGRAVCGGKVEAYVPPFTSANGGRAPGTHRRWRATWLASLPEGVRLTGPEHPAQNDGTCYW